jgi:hypothetical protein
MVIDEDEDPLEEETVRELVWDCLTVEEEEEEVALVEVESVSPNWSRFSPTLYLSSRTGM